MREVRVSVKLPKDISASDEAVTAGRREALESLVIHLWSGGHLSTREAAKRLGLTYVDYIELLGRRGIPIVTEMADEATLQLLHDKLQRERSARK